MKAKPKRGPGRPPVPDDQRRTIVTIRLSPIVLTTADMIAEAEGMTRSQLIERALLTFFEENRRTK